MESFKTRNGFIILASVLFALTGIVYIYNLEDPWYVMPSIWYNDDLHTRGLIHFESMENGMKYWCWNKISKKFLQLVCPIMEPNSELEVEFAFFLTSCFCESVGKMPLYCDIKNNYGRALARCAKGKCHNKYGHDSFHTIYTRMSDLCHYYLQQAASDPKFKSAISDHDLKGLAFEARGAESGRPRLKLLVKLVDKEIAKRREEYKISLMSYLDDLCLILEDFGYKLGLVSYEYSH